MILYYAKVTPPTWNTQYQPHDPEYVRRAYRNEDERGRWQSDQLTASGPRFGESGEPWRGIDPGERGNHWRTPTQGGMKDYIIEHGLIPGWPERYPGVHERLDALDAAGLVAWPKGGEGMPRLKRYLASTKGTAVEDIFADVNRLEAASKEKVGYPTQKPLALLERIILASSNEGDVVLDPFCGCATACVAAEKLGREWIGIDLSEKAAELVRVRLRETPGIGMFWQGAHRTDTPRRTDIDAPKNYRQNKHVLFGQQEGLCNGCRGDFPFKLFEVDHVVPRAKGGGDHIENLQLLCSHCNRTKGDRPQEFLLAKLTEQGVRS